MIFVSTACVKAKKISDAIEILVKSGFTNIELSGGTDYYDGLEEDIVALKRKYSLNYILHNYFPPPKKNFVLNLASLNDELYKKSTEYLVEAVLLSKKLNAPCFGFHAGFYLDLRVSDLGRPISQDQLFDKGEALKRFSDGFMLLQEAAAGQLDLYIENNVLANSKYAHKKPLLLITYEDYLELKKQIKFNLLFDIGHLKVSCKTLGIDFNREAIAMAAHARYYHVSENNGLSDEHMALQEESDSWDLIKSFTTKGSIITLEIKGLDELKRTYDMLRCNLK